MSKAQGVRMYVHCGAAVEQFAFMSYFFFTDLYADFSAHLNAPSILRCQGRCVRQAGIDFPAQYPAWLFEQSFLTAKLSYSLSVGGSGKYCSLLPRRT